MEWRKNLYQYQEEPPAKAWDLISRELDHDAPALRNKLSDIESEPPAQLWQAIANDLDEVATPGEAPVIWYRKPWNIAAAAAFGAVLFGAVYINKYNKAISAADFSTAVVKPLEAPVTNPPLAVESKAASETKLPDTGPAVSVETTATEKAPLASAKTHARPAPKDKNYIYFTSANGDTRRLSYKLEPLLPAIRNKKHNELLDQWSNKLEGSAFVPSGNNFFDIVEMVKMVEEKQ